MDGGWQKKAYFIASLFAVLVLAVYLPTHFASVKIVQYSDNQYRVTFGFLLPMKQGLLTDENLKIRFELPDTRYQYEAKWLSARKLQVDIRQSDLPFGQKITMQFHSWPVKWGPFTVRIKKTFTPLITPASPVLIPEQFASTVKPVLIRFNTFIQPEEIKKVQINIEGNFVPNRNKRLDGTYKEDTSEWLFVPNKPLANNTVYTFIFPKGLKSRSGLSLDQELKRSFRTGDKSKPARFTPAPQSRHIPLYPRIRVEFNELMSSGTIQVVNERQEEVKGTTMIQENLLVFKPDEVLMPDEVYMVSVHGINKFDEPTERFEYRFHTVDTGDKMWVDVYLGKEHTMTVYRGKKVLRRMLASGGRPGYETPLGVYYTRDKGPSFFSHRYGEGARYWVRLFDQYLIHSVPRDDKWEIKREEHDKLGMPASHGCVRLDDEDAKWFYEMVEPGTMVIIRD